jgi:2-aminobenzoate-CoA ligase
VLLEKASPEALLPAIERYRATCASPRPRRTARWPRRPPQHDLRARCASACRPAKRCPRPRALLWKQATGIELIDGIGSTELFHIFISADEAHARPGATGVPVPGYRACVLDEQGRECRMARSAGWRCKGPTGCKYLADERQANYVQNGWNLTGDAYLSTTTASSSTRRAPTT